MTTTRLTEKARWYLAQLQGGAIASVVVTEKNRKAVAQLVAAGLVVLADGRVSLA